MELAPIGRVPTAPLEGGQFISVGPWRTAWDRGPSLRKNPYMCKNGTYMENTLQREWVASALQQLLRPIVRLLLKSGWTWKEFAELAKSVFVEVAIDDFGKRGRPTNSSRVAILTGLGRRDVAVLREQLAREPAPDVNYMSRGSRLLSGWHQDPDFLTQDGQPRVLHFEGDGATFTTLSHRYAGDIPVVAMFKELVATGAVSRDRDGLVRVLRRAFMPTTLSADQLRLWGSGLHDLGATLTHNLTRDPQTPPRFERRAVNLTVDARFLPAYRSFLAREGQLFLERVDDWLSNHEVADEDISRSRLRLGAGVFHIEGPKTKEGRSS